MSSTRPVAHPSGPPSSRPFAHPSGPPSSRPVPGTDDPPASKRSSELEAAKTCFAKGDLDRAEQLARSAHRANSKDPAPLTLLAWYEAQRPANHGIDATKVRVRMMTMAINLDPDHVDAYFYRALLRKRMGDYRNACADLTTVLELDPDRIDGRSELRECEELLSRGGPGLLDRILKR
jgi:tetratricopeptide (TPR) repeat protein